MLKSRLKMSQIGDNEMDTRIEDNKEIQDKSDSNPSEETTAATEQGVEDTSTKETTDENKQSSFLDKYLSDSETEDDVAENKEEKEKPEERKPEKKKVKKKTKTPKSEKQFTPRKPSMRWKNLRLVVGDDRHIKVLFLDRCSDDEVKEVNKPQPKTKQNRKESRSNKQNLQSRRSTVLRIPSEPAESSTESEEEDDRVLDGKVGVADLPSEYWQIQRLIRFLKNGNQVATVITFCALTDFNLTQELTQMAIRDVNGLTVLVNILRTDHVNCQIGALKVLQQLTISSIYNRRAVIKMGGVQILVDLITDAPKEVQSLAAANLANLAKSSVGRNILKKYGGLQKLVGLLNYDGGQFTGRRLSGNGSPGQPRSDLEVARNAALALWSCSKSTRSRSAIFNAGSVPLLAKLVTMDKDEFLVPIVGLVQECAVVLLLEMIGSEDAALQEAAAGCLLNMRQLAMANERARYQEDTNNDLETDTDSVQQN
ncbi:Armadillo repeat-containing protein 4 [Stylophora pistillata]|uniref:Armadillo repeat-containing protein 4 n=1 Tax=Stylophora pistillata TaxID=50429 RepID=A0A2B4S6H2_STYPI|nr:Armadillo repeat-containing protein 4 [Stylophora pistillata]